MAQGLKSFRVQGLSFCGRDVIFCLWGEGGG